MAYASASDVAPLCRNVLSESASNFSASTKPASAMVDIWLSSGCSLINTRLASAGYGPIPANSEAYGLAQMANVLYGGWMVQRQQLNIRSSADENDLAEQYKKDFEFHVDLLLEMDLSLVGVSTTNKRMPYAGGISVSDKSAKQSNTDRVQPRFSRDQFANPERLAPQGISAS